jgi:hypothetical protein|tara:strand:+ start:579 stop:842 length:264 start_codon:yes stop_codon:yes gene_type:complete
MSIKFLGAQAACGVNVGAASTFENATQVRLVNTGAAEYLVSIANSADATLATFTLESLNSIIVTKGSADQIFAANAAVIGTPCNTRR